MRLSAEQFLSRPLNALAPLYLVHGAEPLGALETADRIRQVAKTQGYGEREVFTAEAGFDWSALRGAASALSLFAQLRFIEIRIPTGKPGKEGAAALEGFAARLPDDTITLVTLPEMDWQGRQSKWFTALEEAAVVVESVPVERNRLPQWLAERLRRIDRSASPEALDFLADRVEGNLLAAKQEIEKLGLLAPPGAIDDSVVVASVANVSRHTPADLLAAVHEGDAVRITRILDSLKAESEPPPLILWLLGNELRLLMRLANLTRAGRPPHPAKARELDRLQRRHSSASLMRLATLAARVDRMAKGVHDVDPWDGLMQLAWGLAGIAVLKNI